MTVCNRCGKENQDHYKFCLGCGAELTAAPKAAGGNDVGMMKTMMQDPSSNPLGGVPLGGPGVPMGPGPMPGMGGMGGGPMGPGPMPGPMGAGPMPGPMGGPMGGAPMGGGPMP